MRGSGIAVRTGFLVLIFAFCSAARSALPQTAIRPPHADIRSYRQAHETEILREFAAWLAIPNVSSDKVNIRRNAEFLAAAMDRRGVAVKIMETAGGPPIVFGEWGASGASKTLLAYAHYDGQPVTPEGWKSNPWKPAA